MTPEPRYLPELARLIHAGLIPTTPGRITPVAVLHDDGCDIFEGRACNCSPEIHHPGRPMTPDCCP